jgi:hypothetical protein
LVRVLGGVEDAEQFDPALSNAIDDEVVGSRHDQFTSAVYAARPPGMGEPV